MRLDVWLWAVRLYKTRSLSVEAVKGGQVKINGAATKPAHVVKIGELITARTGEIRRTYEVLGLPKSRVGAPLVAEYAADKTPPEEYERQRTAHLASGYRPPGAGRPTKRERRVLETFFADGEPPAARPSEAPPEPSENEEE